ncbi:pyridoxamine 5'-phosphate oxidase family protein [Sphingobacterium sp.]|uniref:pyridoxamine 5'-phosphate oxidase family protein n=1 Tax=Sphingobacterium sp. TaxID=341027 RepID=UPI0031E33B66
MDNKYMNKSKVNKLRMMIEDLDIGILCTFSESERFPHSITVRRQELDDDGNLWHLISSESKSFNDLLSNENITLIYTRPRDLQFIRIVGTGELDDNKLRIKKYRNHIDSKLFEKGEGDPKIRVLKLAVRDIQYWKSESRGLIAFLKVLGKAISGRGLDSMN